jgi:hypothetical protein
VFTIVDKTGRQITAQLINQPGTTAPPTPPVAPALVVSPPAGYTVGPGVGSCTGKTFSFVISGGTAPFSVTAARGTVTGSPVTTSPGSFFVSGLLDGSGADPIAVADSSTPQKSTVVTVTCN